MSGLPVRVHDAYVTGEGILHASLLGLFSLVDMRGGGKSNRGRIDALLRRGSLVSHGAATYPEEVRWEAVDDRIAYAMLTEGSISTTMLFTFDKQGLMRPWAQRRADAQWTARSFRRPGKVAFGTTTSVTVCEYRSLVRWPGCSARGREALLAWSHHRDQLRVRAVIEGQCQQGLTLRERVLEIISLSGRLSNGESSERLVAYILLYRYVQNNPLPYQTSSRASSLPSSARLPIVAVSMALYPPLRPFPSGSSPPEYSSLKTASNCPSGLDTPS